jgi:hypothetical protein
VGSFDPSGLDWIEYTGQNVSLYGGNYGDRSGLLLSCAATSGAKDFQNIMFRNDVDGDGPLPTGKYKIDLSSDPARYANISQYGTNLYSSTGVQRIHESYLLDGEIIGMGAWGTWRARLEPVRVRSPRTGNFYLHNSKKGYTHGCVETCDALYDALVKYHNQGLQEIFVRIRYSTFFTNGGTKKER